MKIRVAVVGATGYTGFELVALLQHHPKVEITMITSQSYAGKRIDEIFPALLGILCGLTPQNGHGGGKTFSSGGEEGGGSERSLSFSATSSL